MARITFPTDSWILVCDGSKALLFRNAGDALALNLKAVEVFNEPHAATHELGTERPGRTYDSTSGARSAVETTDWHDAAETAFLRNVVGKLDDVLRDHDGPLTVAAPPRALGTLRGLYTPGIKAALTTEIPKDLVKLPTYEIERHLAEMGELK